jgi:hypothetical protein
MSDPSPAPPVEPGEAIAEFIEITEAPQLNMICCAASPIL